MAQSDDTPSPDTLRDVYELMEQASDVEGAVIIVKKVGETWDSTLAAELDHKRSIEE